MSRVILVCGPAGSGKSTHAQYLEDQGYVRLSFDEEAWALGLTIHPLNEEDSLAVHSHLRQRLAEHIEQDHDVVVDTSFWSRASRDAYRRFLRPYDVVPVVHYLDTPREVILARLTARNNTGPHDVVVPHERAVAYLNHFEIPTNDEGPMIFIKAPSN